MIEFDKKNILYKFIPLGLTFLAIVVASVQSYRFTNLLEIKEQHYLLAKAENFFINNEFDSAFKYYEKVDLYNVNDEFLSLRKNIAAFKLGEEGSNEVEVLRENLISLLRTCPQGKGSTVNLEIKSLPELTYLLKECYQDKRNINQEKAQLVEQLSMVKYLNFKNERGYRIHYLGDVVDSTAIGEGVGIWDNESFYRGSWKDNKREGYGYFKTGKGEVYEGEYRNDRRNGVGTYVFRNGDFYTGEWKNGERSGFGTVISARGDTLVHGFWEKDRFDRRKTREYEKLKNKVIEPAESDTLYSKK
jgi:hypothetical protein